MVIKRYSLLILLVFLLMINGVLALKTVVTLSTSYTNHNITANVMDQQKEEVVLANLNNATDDDGITTFTFETEGKKDISIYIIVRKNGKIVTTKQFNDLVSGELIGLELKDVKKSPSSVPAKNQTTQNLTAENKTQVNNTNASAATEKKSENKTKENVSVKEEDAGKITGAASSSSTFKIPSAIYYIIGIIALVVVGLYIFKRAKPYFSFTSQIKESSSAVVGEKSLKKTAGVKDKELEAAEKKIREAEEEIRRIKERNTRIIEAEKRFLEAQKELNRLKSGI